MQEQRSGVPNDSITQPNIYRFGVLGYDYRLNQPTALHFVRFTHFLIRKILMRQIFACTNRLNVMKCLSIFPMKRVISFKSGLETTSSLPDNYTEMTGAKETHPTNRTGINGMDR